MIKILDTVTLKPLDTLRGFNYAAAEAHYSIAAGILHVEGEKGQQLANLWMKELGKTYDPGNWPIIGPALITRIAMRICGSSYVMPILMGKKCQYNFKLLPVELVFNIVSYEKHKFFDEAYAEEVMERLSQSVVAHVWHTSERWVDKVLTRDSKAPYVQLAKKYCPRSLASSYTFV